ncbi:pyrimidine operon attenuation protein / uracil phosphoribosyltransferase [Lishizhenia tianjinensis]|uniref:Pyrimidine operon attenuation protein / uracil phosphoribosyltransferase n=1 Tax=Lishizhenia tianjinensis TaxID=477690 RepID=A0A1I6YKF8_9FLAO|nr:phosphoribosyltransferase family protein [Lishizhenia tianjinensis]SFT50979.1 pyrimidine operon attenuation protein / uracil phosphoribosyltransferase [Lishizhenia tianjinensis]
METLVLSHTQIEQKINRIAHQILENHFEEETIYLAGIEGQGARIAEKILAVLQNNSDQKFEYFKLSLNKDYPFDHKVESTLAMENINDACVILIDDVVNSGKTMQYALVKLLEQPTKTIKTVALVDRRHRRYPIKCDFVGLTLSTTLQERVEVRDEQGELNAYLV